MHRDHLTLILALLVSTSAFVRPASAQHLDAEGCRVQDFTTLNRNPTAPELRCYFGVGGPGRFGLSYADVPVYQPATPMPGTHVVGLPGLPRPTFLESFERWEWRVLRSDFGAEAHRVHRDLDLLDPEFRERIVTFEARLEVEGLTFARRETWRSFRRQAYLFQQGRSRPGALATATLTSWHSMTDLRGEPAGRAVDYDVRRADMPRFHEIARSVGLQTFGPDSNDPGHVFLPKRDVLNDTEIAVLRTLPRVPEVTLATGLPVDRALPDGGRVELYRRARAFAASPFVDMPEARVTPRPRPLTRTPPPGVARNRLAAESLGSRNAHDDDDPGH